MRQDDTVTNQQDDRPSGQDNMTNRQVNRTSRQGDIENRHRVIFDPYTTPQTSSIHAYDTRSSSKYNFYIEKFNLEKLRQAVPIFIKIMEWDTTKRYNVCKKMFQRKLISVLFEILKDNFLWLPWWNHDNTRNKIAKSLTLASFTVALNKFVFLAFDFITHIFSFLFSLLFTYYQVISVLVMLM